MQCVERWEVSIHALRFQRAMLEKTDGPSEGLQVSIHALRFQRAMLQHGGGRRQEGSFNPRPPFPEGDARSVGAKLLDILVSIHALRFQRAMPPGCFRNVRLLDVSIHALRFQRAMHCLNDFWAYQAKFQSTPSVSRGRCSSAKATPARRTCFNPRPPFPEGDATYRYDLPPNRKVSIHALRFQRAMQD